MAYYNIALAAQDNSLRDRIAGCIATLDQGQLSGVGDNHPPSIADSIMWRVVGDKDVSDAYASGVSAKVKDLGSDPEVVTDAMLLAAVQKALNITPPE